MSVTEYVRANEECHISLLHLLPKTEQSDDTGLVPDATH